MINLFLPKNYKVKVKMSHWIPSGDIRPAYIAYGIKTDEDELLGTYTNSFEAFYRCWKHYFFFEKFYKK